MILTKLCELAHSEGLLTNPDYEPKPVAWIIVVGDGGTLLDVIPTTGSDANGRKKARPKVFQIPRRTGRTSATVADFMVDKSEYVLGVEPDGKRSDEELRMRLGLFRLCVQEAVAAIESPALVAVEAFLESDAEKGRAAERIAQLRYKSNDLFAFEYRGQLVHELPVIQEYYSRSRRTSAESGTQCLICGAIAVAVDKHPPVKIPGGTSSGVALVSFNSDAFESYGLSRNENAPVCRDCADAYTTALNRLLDKSYPDPRRSGETLPQRFVRLSPDTTAIFWADEEATILDLLTNFFDAPRVESVAALLEAPHKGCMPGSLTNRFYCLILSGGQGRAVLRGTHTGTVAQVRKNMRAYFESIDVGAEQPLPLFILLRGLVLQGKTENLPPGLASEVFLAIVFGLKFPQTLLARVVERCRAERKVTRERAAVLRAYSIRNFRWEEVNVGLDKDNIRPGYRLGRLMAVLERVQGSVQNNPNKTIVDRYYGAASTRPATVFPRLLALAQHHVAKLKGGLAVFYQRQLGEVMDGLPSFPATLSLEEQGLFALGYYHQRQEFYKRAESAPADGNENEKVGAA
jgi:CRISPR-associated protein Csd1